MAGNEAIKWLKAWSATHQNENDNIRESVWSAIQALEEIQAYRAIGTVEECKSAVERMKPRKPKSKTIKVEIYNAGGFTRDKKISVCGSCGNELLGCSKFCDKCGRAIDWSE